MSQSRAARVSSRLFVLLIGVASCRSAEVADIIFVNGKIITVDSTDRVAEAVAVKGDKIVAVGTNAEIERRLGRGTRRIDLAGRAMTPGLIDAHAHFAWGSTNRILLIDLSYPEVKTVADVAARVAAKAALTAPGGWVEGRGWDEGKLTERRLLTAADLDRAAPNHPVWLQQTTGHYGVANSAALKLAGIDRTTKNPPAGTIDRGPDGAPTGVLKESAQDLVTQLIPAPADSVVVRGMKSLAQAFNAEGMTGLKDPGISGATWNAYRRALADSGLSVRVFVLWTGGISMATADTVIAERAAMSKPYQSTGDDRLIAGGVKLYIDGSGGARTAWLYDDWNKNLTEVDRGNRGYPTTSPDTIRALIKRYHDAGFHLSVHSIGDRAIDWTVDSYVEALKTNPAAGRRHGIIHANIPTDRAIDVMAGLQRQYDAGYPEPSPAFTWWIGDTYAGNFGPVRSRRLNPFKTFKAKGIRWAGSSDYNVTPFPARYGIWSAVAREPLLGIWGKDPFGRDEAIDVHAALRAFTIDAAHQMFLEKKTGSIEPGKYADLAVWDRDPYAVPTAELKEMRCQLTVMNGRIVFEREASAAKP
jgi:predicted amidohydrolase YtcJ